MRTLDGRGFLADTDMPNRSWLEAYVRPEDQPPDRRYDLQALMEKGSMRAVDPHFRRHLADRHEALPTERTG